MRKSRNDFPGAAANAFNSSNPHDPIDRIGVVVIENLVRILGHEIAVAINLESTLHDHAFSTPSRLRESRRVSPPYPRVSFGCGLAVPSRFSPLRQPHRTLGRARIPALAAARVGNCRTRCRETGDWAEEPKDLSLSRQQRSSGRRRLDGTVRPKGDIRYSLNRGFGPVLD